MTAPRGFHVIDKATWARTVGQGRYSTQQELLEVGSPWLIRETPPGDDILVAWHARWGILTVPYNTVALIWNLRESLLHPQSRHEGRLIAAVFTCLAQSSDTTRAAVLGALAPFTDARWFTPAVREHTAVFWNVYKAALAEARRARTARR